MIRKERSLTAKRTANLLTNLKKGKSSSPSSTSYSNEQREGKMERRKIEGRRREDRQSAADLESVNLHLSPSSPSIIISSGNFHFHFSIFSSRSNNKRIGCSSSSLKKQPKVSVSVFCLWILPFLPSSTTRAWLVSLPQKWSSVSVMKINGFLPRLCHCSFIILNPSFQWNFLSWNTVCHQSSQVNNEFTQIQLSLSYIMNLLQEQIHSPSTTHFPSIPTSYLPFALFVLYISSPSCYFNYRHKTETKQKGWKNNKTKCISFHSLFSLPFDMKEKMKNKFSQPFYSLPSLILSTHSFPQDFLFDHYFSCLPFFVHSFFPFISPFNSLVCLINEEHLIIIIHANL